MSGFDGTKDLCSEEVVLIECPAWVQDMYTYSELVKQTLRSREYLPGTFKEIQKRASQQPSIFGRAIF